MYFTTYALSGKPEEVWVEDPAIRFRDTGAPLCVLGAVGVKGRGTALNRRKVPGT